MNRCKKMMLTQITEVFESIQGEGANTGTPSIFVRFFGCNLRCQFEGSTCDTPYAVYFKYKDAKEYTIEKLFEEIKKFNSTHIVFTGGEPMLYQNFIGEFMEHINKDNEYTCEIESNGTIPFICKIINRYLTHFNLSVKLKSSNQKNRNFDILRINPEAIRSYPANKSIFKFVITNKNDIKEILKLVKAFDIKDVYLMPQGTTREDIIKNSDEVIALCKLFQFKFSSRLHILLWDRKKGV